MKKLIIRCVFLCAMIMACSWLMIACGQNNSKADGHIHAFGEWEISKNASCSADGEKVRYCYCGDMQTGTIAATGHAEVVDAAVASTCTEAGKSEGKHCSICNEVLVEQSIISATGHEFDWAATICTTPRTCLTCGATDGIVTGHYYVNGVCEFCGDSDPNYAKPEVIVNKTSLNLTDTSEVVCVTLLNWDIVSYKIEDTSIVNCEWGGWNGNTITLTFIPVSSGSTTVKVFPKDYDTYVLISVTVKMSTAADRSSITIDGVGEEFLTYISASNYKRSIINSVDYTISNAYGNTIQIEIDVYATMIKSVSTTSSISIAYELFDENGVCVKADWFSIRASHLNQVYSHTIKLYLEEGNYTLVFRDYYW